MSNSIYFDIDRVILLQKEIERNLDSLIRVYARLRQLKEDTPNWNDEISIRFNSKMESFEMHQRRILAKIKELYVDGELAYRIKKLKEFESISW